MLITINYKSGIHKNSTLRAITIATTITQAIPIPCLIISIPISAHIAKTFPTIPIPILIPIPISIPIPIPIPTPISIPIARSIHVEMAEWQRLGAASDRSMCRHGSAAVSSCSPRLITCGRGTGDGAKAPPLPLPLPLP